jgi:hypothetical protein
MTSRGGQRWAPLDADSEKLQYACASRKERRQ